jgi:hypothetical protein
VKGVNIAGRAELRGEWTYELLRLFDLLVQPTLRLRGSKESVKFSLRFRVLGEFGVNLSEL